MDHVASSIASVKDFRLGGGDSFSDRLSCRYTAAILVMFALMVTTKHYMGEPISCWCPSHLTDAQVSNILTYMFASVTTYEVVMGFKTTVNLIIR